MLDAPDHLCYQKYIIILENKEYFYHKSIHRPLSKRAIILSGNIYL